MRRTDCSSTYDEWRFRRGEGPCGPSSLDQVKQVGETGAPAGSNHARWTSSPLPAAACLLTAFWAALHPLFTGDWIRDEYNFSYATLPHDTASWVIMPTGPSHAPVPTPPSLF
jgi:hypothetical protein